MTHAFRLLGLLVVIQTSSVLCEEQSQLFVSPRVMGRGGAFVAAFDSDEASTLNPATLGESKITYQLRFLQFDAMVAENTVSTISDLASFASSSDGAGVLKKFDDTFGDKQYFRMQVSPFAQRFGRFEFSPFVLNESWLLIDSIPSMEWQVDTAAGGNISYGFNVNPNLLLGVTLRPIYRWFVKGSIIYTDLLDFIPPSDTKFEDYTPLVSGLGINSDIGTIWTPSPTFRWGFLIQNVGDTSSTHKYETVPPKIKQKVSTGITKRFPLGSRSNFDWHFDVQDLFNRQGLNITRLTHTGVELGSRIFSRDHDFGLLAGLNEGYVTGGLFADLYFLRLDLIRYTVEEGHTPGQNPGQRYGISARSTMTF